MTTTPDYRSTHERNKAELKAVQDATPDGYLGDRLCPSSQGHMLCMWLRGHEGIHVGLAGSWCDKGHPCSSARQHIDFEKHPRHYVCPRCSVPA